MDIKWPSRYTNPQCIRHWQDIAICTYIDPLKSSHSTHFLIHSCTLRHSSFKICLKINRKRHIYDTHIHTRPSPNTNLVHSQWQDIAICTYINPLESSHSTHFLIHDCTTLFLTILPQDQPLERDPHTYTHTHIRTYHFQLPFASVGLLQRCIFEPEQTMRVAAGARQTSHLVK